MVLETHHIRLRTATTFVLLILSFTVVPMPSHAHPAPVRLEAPVGFQTIKRCPPRYRRSTITGLCVRTPWRLPWLGWYISR